MVIRSQDKLLSIVFENINGIGPSSTGLLAITNHGKYVLGTYSTDEQQIQIQDEITEAYANGVKVYQMPEDNIPAT